MFFLANIGNWMLLGIPGLFGYFAHNHSKFERSVLQRRERVIAATCRYRLSRKAVVHWMFGPRLGGGQSSFAVMVKVPHSEVGC